MAIVATVDGSCNPNPGKMGIGVILEEVSGQKDYDNCAGEVLYVASELIGYGTNNVAEYRAILQALKIAHEKFSTPKILVVSDSKLVCEQLQGTYKIRSKKLRELNQTLKDYFTNFSSVHILWKPRTSARLVQADILSKQGARAAKLAGELVQLRT